MLDVLGRRSFINLRLAAVHVKLLVDVSGLSELQHVTLVLNLEQLLLLLRHVRELLHEWNLAQHFTTDHHIEQVALALVIEH